MRVGRIPYINCYPVYGAIDRGLIRIDADLVDGVPTALNALIAEGKLDVSVVSAVEYARDSRRYLLLPDLAISCDGPVRSVMLFSKRPATELSQRRVLVSRSSMTSVALLELLFENVWHARPAFVPTDAEISDVARFGAEDHEARLVIGDAALLLESHSTTPGGRGEKPQGRRSNRTLGRQTLPRCFPRRLKAVGFLPLDRQFAYGDERVRHLLLLSARAPAAWPPFEVLPPNQD